MKFTSCLNKGIILGLLSLMFVPFGEASESLKGNIQTLDQAKEQATQEITMLKELRYMYFSAKAKEIMLSWILENHNNYKDPNFIALKYFAKCLGNFSDSDDRLTNFLKEEEGKKVIAAISDYCANKGLDIAKYQRELQQRELSEIYNDIDYLLQGRRYMDCEYIHEQFQKGKYAELFKFVKARL